MAVKLIQLLCPNRHCVLAGAYDDTETADDKALEAFRRGALELFQIGALERRCGWCGSVELEYDVGTTRFQTLEEAAPLLRACEAAQMRSRLAHELGHHRVN